MKKLFSFFIASLATLQADQIQLAGRLLDPSYYGVTSHQGQHQEMYDCFTLSSASDLATISWYGLFSSGSTAMPLDTGSFRVFLFSDNPARDPLTYANPDNVPITDLPDLTAFYSVTSSATGTGVGLPDPLHGGEILKWNLPLDGLALDPGTYWLSISATAADPGYFLWSRGQSAVDSAFFGEVYDDAPNVLMITPEHCAMAWDITGTQSVPDNTSSLGLIVLGLFGISIRKRFTDARHNSLKGASSVRSELD